MTCSIHTKSLNWSVGSWQVEVLAKFVFTHSAQLADVGSVSVQGASETEYREPSLCRVHTRTDHYPAQDRPAGSRCGGEFSLNVFRPPAAPQSSSGQAADNRWMFTKVLTFWSVISVFLEMSAAFCSSVSPLYLLLPNYLLLEATLNMNMWHWNIE